MKGGTQQVLQEGTKKDNSEKDNSQQKITLNTGPEQTISEDGTTVSLP
jgi:hypothetical protein